MRSTCDTIRNLSSGHRINSSCPVRCSSTETGFGTAVWTSARAVTCKPGPGGLVGLVVAAGLLVGSIPLVPGLVIVMPMLGHATWHRYRRIVPR